MSSPYAKVLVALLMVIGVGAGVLHLRPDWALLAAMHIERGRADLEQKIVQVDDHTIMYLEGGTGPTLLLIHGFGGDKDNWTRVARYLTDDFRVIALDLPGFGESTRIESASYDILSQVARIEAFRSTLRLGPVHVVGNSRGGQMATHFSRLHGDSVKSLTLLNARGVTSPVLSDFDQILETGRHPLMIRDSSDYENILDWVFVDKPYIPGPIRVYFADRAVELHAFQKKVYSDQVARPAPLDHLLGEVLVPTLIAWGDQDRIIDPSTAEVFHRGIAGSKLVMLYDCGHMPQIEKAEKVSELIAEHVNSVP